MFRGAVRAMREALPLLKPSSKGGACYNVEQTRSTVIVERMYPVRLGKKGSMPKLQRRHRVLKFVDRVHSRPTPKISCVLLDYVEGIGMKGDVVEIKRSQFRNLLYPAKLATYATPENLEEYATKDDGTEKEIKMTATGQLTFNQLETFHLRIPMNGEKAWTLTKGNVKVALRKMGIEVQESCLTLPREVIMEPQEITVGIVINQQVTVFVKATVYNVYQDRKKNRTMMPTFPPVWTKEQSSAQK